MNMKKSVGILILALFLTQTLSEIAFAETNNKDGNLFKNGDFETGLLTPTKLNLYSIAQLGITSEEKHSGNYSLKISNRKDQSCGWGQDAEVEAGKTYIFSGWAKAAESAKKTGYPYSVYFFNGGSFERISGADVLTMQKGNGWQWTKFERVVKAKTDAVTFPCLNLWSSGDDTADYYVDDLYFGELRVADIRFGNFEKEIAIPKEGSTTVTLSGYALNQLGDTYGMENEKITFRIIGQNEGVSLEENKLIVSSKAKKGEIRIVSEVKPSFNALPTVSKNVSIRLTNEDGNLFENGDFETGLLTPTKLNLYSIAQLGITSEEKHGGNYSLKISNRKDQSCGWGQDAEVKAGKTYIFSGWAKAAESAKKTGYPYSVYFFNGGNFERISGADVLTMQKGNGWQWTKFERVVKAKTDAVTFPCLNLWSSGDDTADYYVDDLYFGELRVADIQLGNFEKEIAIPKEGSTTVTLSGYALNQLGDTYGMENEKITFRMIGQNEGVSLDENKLIVSNKAKKGEIRIVSEVKPSFNALPTVSKNISIRLTDDNLNDYKLSGAWEKTANNIRYTGKIIKQNDIHENLNFVAAVYGEKGELADVSVISFGDFFGEKTFTTKLMEYAEKGKYKLFLWRGNDQFGMVPADAANEDETICFYVSSDGDDGNDGTFERPFKTITRARNAIRALSSSERNEKITVFLRKGEYNEELYLNAADSGDITYMAYPGEKVVMSGAKKISRSDLKKVSDTQTLERIPQDARDKIYCVSLESIGIAYNEKTPWYGRYSYTVENFVQGEKLNYNPSELFCNDVPFTLARYPNDGYLTIKSVINKGSYGNSLAYGDTWEPFTVETDDERTEKWKNASNALLYGHWKYLWANQSVPLKYVDADKGYITSEYPTAFEVKEGQDFYIYNLIEELDSCGEYYIEDGVLYVYLSGDEEEFEFSTLKKPIITLDSCSNVKIENISFKNTCSNAIKCTNIEDVMVSGCEIYNTADYAIQMQGKNSGVYNCYIHDVDGGILISGGERESLTKSGMFVENCEIENFARNTKTYTAAIYPRGVGVTVRNNEIHGSEHLAIEFAGNDHVFEYNEIYDVCQNAEDAGAVYTLRDPIGFGNVLRYNYIHDVGTNRYPDGGIYGIYMDDGQCGGDIYGNVFENITGAGIHHAGRASMIKNNIFINCGKSVLYTYRDGTSLLQNLPKWYNNKVWTERFPDIENITKYMNENDWNREHILDNNVRINTMEMWCNDSRIEVYMGTEYESDRDPGFEDYQNKKYGLRNDSEIFEKLNEFENIPFDKIGRERSI